MRGGVKQVFVKFLGKPQIAIDLPSESLAPRDIIKATLARFLLRDKTDDQFRIFRGSKEILDLDTPILASDATFHITLKALAPSRDEEGYRDLKALFEELGRARARVIVDSAACTDSIEKNISQQFMFQHWAPTTVLVDGQFSKTKEMTTHDLYKYIEFEEISSDKPRVRIFHKKAGLPIRLSTTSGISDANKRAYLASLLSYAEANDIDLEKESITYYLVQYNHSHTPVETVMRDSGKDYPMYVWTGQPIVV